MSQQIPGTNSERDFNDPPAFGTDHNDDDQDFGYASQMEFAAPTQPQSAYAVPFYQPIVDHDNALLLQGVAQTNKSLPLAQPEHDARHQYPAQYPWQTNPRNATAFDVYRPGSFNPNAGFYNDSLNLQYGGIDLGPASQLPPVSPSNNVYDRFQQMMPAMNEDQPFPGYYSPPPSVFTSPTAPVPAPSTNAASIRCPEGCPGTFGRNEEMRRHMRKHQEPRFKCPIYDCPMTFYRKDKLQDHAKKGHRGRDVLNIC